jgi:hypothetical protein
METRNTLNDLPHVNSTLITNTSIIEASRLITFGDSGPSDGESWGWEGGASKHKVAVRRLVEFCDVSEAVVLNDYVYTLPSKDPEDVTRESLSSVLRDAGIRKELESGQLSNKAIASVRNLLGEIGNNRVYELSIPFIEGKSSIPGVDDNFDTKDSWRRRTREYKFFVPDARVIEVLKNSIEVPTFEIGKRFSGYYTESTDPLSNFLNSYGEQLSDVVSPATDFVIVAIRSVLYWVTAEHYKIAYRPDCFRVEWTKEWMNSWRATLSKQLYQIIAKAFSGNVQEVMEDEEPQTLLLPPIPAMIIERSSSIHEIPNVLLELRDEFAGFRKSFGELESERRNARSIAQRKKIKKRIKKLFEATAKKSESKQTELFISAIGYTDEVADIVTSPSDPKGYIKLFQQGAEWLRTWWLARPAFRLFSLRKRVESIREYTQLSEKLLGRSLSEDEISEFTNSYMLNKSKN